MPRFSLVYQITQDCIFDCDICHRYFREGQYCLSNNERLEMVNILKERGLKRLAITGGEPTLLKNELYDFIESVHRKRIHTSLITTTIGITREQFLFLESCLDHIMIPFRSIEKSQWLYDFGQTEPAKQLYDKVLRFINWSKHSQIITEINTVVHRENIHLIDKIGDLLATLNPNIVWRLDEYSPIGVKQKCRNKYLLANGEFTSLVNDVKTKYSQVFKEIRVLPLLKRKKSTELFITQSGELIQTTGNLEKATKYNILGKKLPPSFENLRPWDFHRRVCRNFEWE